MSRLFTRASVNGASLTGANLKATLVALWDALNSVGVTDAARATVTASATLATTQCGILLVDCTSGSVTLTLPTSGAATDEAEYRIRRIDSSVNTLTVQRGGTDTIEAGTSFTIGAGQQFDVKLPAGSADWKVLGRGGGTLLQARAALGLTGAVIDSAFGSYATNASLTAQIPIDDTIPQNIEGTEIISVSFTPKSATNRLRLRFSGPFTLSGNGTGVAAIFSSASANALSARAQVVSSIQDRNQLMVEHEYVPGVTTALTFSVRAGPASALTMRFNGSTVTRDFGGAAAATLVIEEIAA